PLNVTNFSCSRWQTATSPEWGLSFPSTTSCAWRFGFIPRLRAEMLCMVLDWTSSDLIFSKALMQYVTVRAPTLSRPEEDGRNGHHVRAHNVKSDVVAK